MNDDGIEIIIIYGFLMLFKFEKIKKKSQRMDATGVELAPVLPEMHQSMAQLPPFRLQTMA